MKFIFTFTILCIVCINALYIDDSLEKEDNRVSDVVNTVYEDDINSLKLDNAMDEDVNYMLNIVNDPYSK